MPSMSWEKWCRSKAAPAFQLLVCCRIVDEHLLQTFCHKDAGVVDRPISFRLLSHFGVQFIHIFWRLSESQSHCKDCSSTTSTNYAVLVEIFTPFLNHCLMHTNVEGGTKAAAAKVYGRGNAWWRVRRHDEFSLADIEEFLQEGSVCCTNFGVLNFLITPDVFLDHLEEKNFPQQLWKVFLPVAMLHIFVFQSQLLGQ